MQEECWAILTFVPPAESERTARVRLTRRDTVLLAEELLRLLHEGEKDPPHHLMVTARVETNDVA